MICNSSTSLSSSSSRRSREPRLRLTVASWQASRARRRRAWGWSTSCRPPSACSPALGRGSTSGASRSLCGVSIIPNIQELISQSWAKIKNCAHSYTVRNIQYDWKETTLFHHPKQKIINSVMSQKKEHYAPILLETFSMTGNGELLVNHWKEYKQIASWWVGLLVTVTDALILMITIIF